MLRYSPVNLIPMPRLAIAPVLGDLTPLKPNPPQGLPSWAVNLIMIGSGAAMSMIAFPYRKKAIGSLVAEAGAGVAAIGIIFSILDVTGFTKP